MTLPPRRLNARAAFGGRAASAGRVDVHPIRRAFVFAGVVAVLTMLIASSTLAANGRSDRGVHFFQGQKTCMPVNGAPHCILTTSNLGLLMGAGVAYISVPPIVGEPGTPSHRIESDILLTTAAVAGSRQSTANGHCTFYISTSTGLCTYSGGTRELKGFHAEFLIGPTSVAPNVYSVIGKYWFRGANDNEQD
jgi:hypothetical protein